MLCSQFTNLQNCTTGNKMGIFLFVFLFAVVRFCSPAKVFERYLDISMANFEVHKSHRLYSPYEMNATTMEPSSMDCAFSCLRSVNSCFSYNFKKTPEKDGLHICEALFSDKYNNSQYFKSDQEFDHFSILNPCSESPCINGGACIALYYYNDFKCKCRPQFKGKNCEIEAQHDCSDLYKAGITTSDVYAVDPDGKGNFSVYCDMTTDGGGWTVFQRRQNGSQDFFRGWSHYKSGFGTLTGEFWLGNDHIHRLTASRPSELRVDVEDWSGGRVYAKYDGFRVGNEQSMYNLSVGSYSGTAGDSLSYHNHMAFTTKDSDNDNHDGANCAVSGSGAWWYNHCYYSNLNGLYLGNKIDENGINWFHYKENRLSMKFTEMKLRPTN